MANRDYVIAAPDGRELTINGPDDASPEQLKAAAKRAYAALPAKPAAEPERTLADRIGKPSDMLEGLKGFVGKDLVAGAVRGAAGIGATIMQPFQALEDKLTGRTAPTLSSLVTGQRPPSSNEETRAGIEGGVAATGADPSSLAFQTGRLGAEIAGTSGVGGVLAGPARAVGAVPLANALASGGLNTGRAVAPTLAGRAADMGTRMVGGAATGAASAGLVDPSSATAGGVVGAVLPPAMRAAGAAGAAAGRVLRGPEQAPEVAAAIQAARQSGYVIPPTQANPTLVNRLMEGFAGKLTTAQNASARNQAVTNAKAATALGLPADAKITPEVLADVRDTAGRAYADIGATGMVTPKATYDAALDKIAAPYQLTAGAFPNAKPSPVLELVDSLRSPAFASASAVEKIKQLRTAADDAFRTGNTDVGRASKAAAKALEDAIEDHLTVIGQPDLLDKFRNARELIAKTYSVEKALNKETGTVDARKLAAQLARGKPLSGDLKDAAAFASRFPKAAQAPEAMGSLPGTSPLDWGLGAGLSVGMGNPLMMAGAAARPVARSAALSPLVQNRLLQSAPMAMPTQLNPLIYRGAPLIAADQ